MGLQPLQDRPGQGPPGGAVVGEELEQRLLLPAADGIQLPAVAELQASEGGLLFSQQLRRQGQGLGLPRPASSWAPAPRGVDPSAETIVTSTASSPRSRRDRRFSKIVRIGALLSLAAYQLPGQPPARSGYAAQDSAYKI